MKPLFLMQQVFSTLGATCNKVMAYGDQSCGELTSRQFITILAIGHIEEGNASYNQIALKLGTTKQNVKQIVVSLEKKGFVRIEKHPSDKRAVNVVVTEAGIESIMQNAATANAYLERLASGFTEEELQTLWYLLMKLYAFDGETYDGFEKEARW